MRFDAVAIVPAGGSGRRLGSLAPAGKPALPVGGRTFLDRVVSALAVEVPRVIVVTGPGRTLPAVGTAIEVVGDSSPGAGPLAALRDGLVHALAGGAVPRLAVLCACDLPFVKPAVVRLLLERASAPQVRWALPVVGGHPQPLLSVLATDVLAEVEDQVRSGRGSLRDLAAAVGRSSARALLEVDARELRVVDPELAAFVDVDTAADLAHLAERASPRGGAPE